MTRREFGQYCGLARALELVGERWAMLIIRELLVRPCRYTDLIEGLPGIPTNMLSTRLKELEQAGIVERRIASAPQRGVVYAVTEHGRSLEPALIALAVWGNTRLNEQQPTDLVPPSSLVISMRARFNREAAGGMSAVWEIRVPETVLHAVVTDGQLTAGIGPAPSKPDLVVTVPGEVVPTFRNVLEAIAAGKVELTGRRSLAGAFTRVFTPQQQALSVSARTV